MKEDYKGWLVSNSFIKRALAVYGYSFVGSFIIIIPLFVIFLIIFWMGSFEGGYDDAGQESPRQEISE